MCVMKDRSCVQQRGTLLSTCAVGCRGVLNIVHGTHDTVNRICDHPDIKAVSFVGSNAAGEYIYERGSKNGKRVQVSPLSTPVQKPFAVSGNDISDLTQGNMDREIPSLRCHVCQTCVCIGGMRGRGDLRG